MKGLRNLSFLPHEADEADGLKRVAAAERVEDGRETVASHRSERFVYFINYLERNEVCEVSARQLPYLGKLFKMLHDGANGECARFGRLF